MDKIWKIKEKAPGDIFEELSEYPELIAQLLFNRGITTKKEAGQFFEPDYKKDLLDPFLALGMKHAVERIKKAIKNKEKIVIFHDYDADGVCSSVVVASTLKEFGADFSTYTPDRQKEGYGLNKKALKEILKDKPDLLITTDCGITDIEEVEFMNENGVDVVIIDHHLPGDVLPPAYAIVNPKQKKCEYEFKYLCAAGVAFKLCSALIESDFGKEKKIKEGFEKWLLDVVAIATIADMMPLLGENRTLVKYGLMVVKKTKRLGLRKLLESSSYGKNSVDSTMIAFGIAPKINATSRMTHASVSFDLLFTESEDEAEKLLVAVEKANNDRRKFVEKAAKDAIFWIEKELLEKGKLPEVVIMGNDEWTPGIVGLIAGKLTQKYNRPSFVYGRIGNIFKGSCRGVSGFNIVDAMAECEKRKKGLFKAFGGHAQAGGFAVKKDDMGDFKKILSEVGKKRLKNIEAIEEIETELEILPDQISFDNLKWLLKFEPYGQGNVVPIFSVKNIEVSSVKLVGKNDKHIKMSLRADLSDGSIKFFDAIGFNLGDFYTKIKKGDKIDIAFSIEENEWNGNVNIQLKLKDIKKLKQ
jgi:single-stranded-DNA-specific exonuclease